MEDAHGMTTPAAWRRTTTLNRFLAMRSGVFLPPVLACGGRFGDEYADQLHIEQYKFDL